MGIINSVEITNRVSIKVIADKATQDIPKAQLLRNLSSVEIRGTKPNLLTSVLASGTQQLSLDTTSLLPDQLPRQMPPIQSLSISEYSPQHKDLIFRVVAAGLQSLEIWGTDLSSLNSLPLNTVSSLKYLSVGSFNPAPIAFIDNAITCGLKSLNLRAKFMAQSRRPRCDHMGISGSRSKP